MLINDVVSWSQRLDATFVSLPDDSWNRPVRSGRGDEHPVARLPFHRWWEVEVHLVDLAIGHTPADWPQELVDRALPRLVAGLANRADPRSLMAWTLAKVRRQASMSLGSDNGRCPPPPIVESVAPISTACP